MKQFTQRIFITEEQAGQKKLTAPASLHAYILDPLTIAPDRKRPAVIICPGGGYGHLSDREGEPVATQLLSMGCHAFVFHYSLAPDGFPFPQLELAMAISYIRSHASEWLVDPERIIVSGFSAGGHLACSLGAFWNREFLYAPLKLDPEAIRPDGMILGYPVITAGPYCHAGSFKNLLGTRADDEAMRHLVSLEYQVGAHTPKTFLWHTSTDDAVPVKNSLLLADALTAHGVSVEMHIYPAGCHGLSLATKEVSGADGRYVQPQCQSWLPLAKTWLEYF
ncbi:alpha/beta hydrolase [Clostridium sp. Marseille-P2415]|uniref:alpha/beta hydrolase n=1 Tax=Clostridium sp. Marseille-P2415 TaxID=1805471 RepID=UPI0009883624|nr:alpha/beta hydrolase [Clostridium sp. Marseille-P2415]